MSPFLRGEMNMYANIKRRMHGRMLVITILFFILAGTLLTNGFNMLFTEGPSYTYLEQTEKIFKERGQVLPEKERVRLMEMDANMNAQMRRERRLWAPVLMLFGLAAGAAGLLTLVRGMNVPGSKLGKLVALYMAQCGETDLNQVLAELDRELAVPLYDSRHITLTANWLVGHTGITRQAVAIPYSCITGVYYYHLLRIRPGRGTTRQFHIMLNDRFDKERQLWMASLKQLDELYPLVCEHCPHAAHGTYKEDYARYRSRPKQEREEQIRRILDANRADGMLHVN